MFLVDHSFPPGAGAEPGSSQVRMIRGPWPPTGTGPPTKFQRITEASLSIWWRGVTGSGSTSTRHRRGAPFSYRSSGNPSPRQDEPSVLDVWAGIFANPFGISGEEQWSDGLRLLPVSTEALGKSCIGIFRASRPR